MKKTNEIDKKLGHNLVKHRILKGKSRKDLAEKVGVTHQQLQKYENGINRVSVSRLYEICEALDVSIDEVLDIESVDINISRAKHHVEIYKYLAHIHDSDKLEAIKNLVKSMAISPAS